MPHRRRASDRSSASGGWPAFMPRRLALTSRAAPAGSRAVERSATSPREPAAAASEPVAASGPCGWLATGPRYLARQPGTISQHAPRRAAAPPMPIRPRRRRPRDRAQRAASRSPRRRCWCRSASRPFAGRSCSPRRSCRECRPGRRQVHHAPLVRHRDVAAAPVRIGCGVAR